MFRGQKFTYIEERKPKNKTKSIKSKHQASKKGYIHKHNLSLGEKNHLKFIGGK